MTVPLVLYHTSGCHLCEKAKDLLWPFLSSHQISLVEIDIAESDLLIESYGIRIPVVASPSGAELDWPFDQNQIASLIESKD
jgi:glutaredoxin